MVASVGFSIYSIMLPANSDNLGSFNFFTCLISMPSTFNTVLNKSGRSGHPCLVCDLRRNDFSFLPLNMMADVGLSNMDFIIHVLVVSVGFSTYHLIIKPDTDTKKKEITHQYH